MYSKPLLFILLIGFFSGCRTESNDKLPFIGNHPNPDAGVYHTVRNFTVTNQDRKPVSLADFQDKAYVFDLFFTSCPTICPKVKQQMLRLQEKFGDDDRLHFLSHTVDIKYDTPDKLKAYAQKLGINTNKWHLVTGDFKKLEDIAEDHMSIVMQDDGAPGGFDHSGRLILVDKDKHVRAFCNGTDPDEVTAFMNDIEKLLNEMDSAK